MDTIALRFSDNFAPPEGTIAAHMKYISENGSVWYGKLGLPVSSATCKTIMANDAPRILLIHSGKTSRYWAYVKSISHEPPALNEVPSYYRGQAENFHTWFLINNFVEAERDILSKCVVLSSGARLSDVSKGSMSPYFIIRYNDGAREEKNDEK